MRLLPGAPASGVTWKAVIVESATSVQAMMIRQLKARGFTIAATLDWDQAPAEVRALKAHLLILEVGHGEELVLRIIEALAAEMRELRVIVTAPAAKAELILKVLRAGATEFLVRPVSPEEFSSALDRVVRSLAPGDGANGQVLAVYTGKGGLGNTTVAVNLAFSLARSHPEERVALVDMAMDGADVQVFLDLKPQYSVSDLLGKTDRLDTQLLEEILYKHPQGPWVLPETGLPEDADAMTGNEVAEIIARLRAAFDFVVVDCEHQLTDRSRSVLDSADKILVLTVLNVPAIRQLQRTLEMLKRLGHAEEKVHIIVNRQNGRDVFQVRDVEKSLDRSVFWQLPNDYKTASRAITRGKPLLTTAPRSKLSRGVDGLATALNSTEVGSRSGTLAARMRKMFLKSNTK